MLNEYYFSYGWDENGIPIKNIVERLGIKNFLGKSAGMKIKVDKTECTGCLI